MGLPARWWWCFPIVGSGFAVLVSVTSTHLAGFPLDDSWIHQDFARTLATTGQFAYLPGRSAAGSTSPLWVLLLVPPYWLAHGSPSVPLLVTWVAALGWLALAGIGVTAGWAAFDLAGLTHASYRVRLTAAILAGVACAAEWHLDWAAVSGMETDLFALVVLALFVAASRKVSPIVSGLFVALAISLRPEGILAALVVIVGALVGAMAPRRAVTGVEGLHAESPNSLSESPGMPAHHGRARYRTRSVLIQDLRHWSLRWLVPFMVTIMVGTLPYLWFNWLASGHLLPSTLYAKSAYFDVGNFLQMVASDLGGVALTVIGGSPVILLLGALSYSHWLLNHGSLKAERASQHSDLFGPHPSDANTDVSLRWILWLWIGGLVILYAGHGVETLVHGRYLIPTLPALIALGAAGAAPVLVSTRQRLLGVVAGILLVGSGVFSLVRGAQIFAANVGFINATQVATALWLKSNTKAGTLVATHDIGAIGYFSGDQVVDIAGLVDPELIPLINNQAALEAALRARHVAYVVIYTDWFLSPNTLVHDLAPNTMYRAPGTATFVVYKTSW